jgi:hypothetical protein
MLLLLGNFNDCILFGILKLFHPLPLELLIDLVKFVDSRPKSAVS